MVHLAELKYQDLKKLEEKRGLKKDQISRLWQNYYSTTHITSIDELKLDNCGWLNLSTLALVEVKESSDGVSKYLFKLEDGSLIETVLIPDGKRATACISSQVGCKFGCSFCVTGSRGFLRDLKIGEIVEQVLQIQWHKGLKVTNVVYMGMGEPFDNFDNVSASISIMADLKGLAIAPRKITVSTAGYVPGIYKMADGAFKASLAISLHSPFEVQRSQLMPGISRYSIEELLKALEYYCRKTGKKIYFEYLLLKGINDSISHADAVVEIMRRIPSKLNLIRYNSGVAGGFEKSEVEIENSFYYYVINKGIKAVFRRSRGEDIDAACGQLSQK